VPLARESLHANITLARFAGALLHVQSQHLAEATPANGHLDPGEHGLANLTVTNLGLEDLSSARVRLVSVDADLQIDTGPWSEPFDLPSQAGMSLDPLAFFLPEDAPLGLVNGLALELAAAGGSDIVPLAPFFSGTPTLIFEDSIEDLSGWATEGWGLTAEAHSPPHALTDSPGGNYSNGADNAVSLAEPLNLSDASSPVLRYYARWDIEAFYDQVQVLASTDGYSWTPLAGRNARPGSGLGVQPAGEPVYHGKQLSWTLEEVDLSAFAGAPAVYLQWRLRADDSGVAAGFFLDDIRVYSFNDGSAVAAEPGSERAAPGLGAPFPNPSRGAVYVALSLPAPGYVLIEVIDLLGRTVATLEAREMEPGSHVLAWDGHDHAGRPASAGIYVLRARAAGQTLHRTLTLVP
jgi:hypothetical protein